MPSDSKDKMAALAHNRPLYLVTNCIVFLVFGMHSINISSHRGKRLSGSDHGNNGTFSCKHALQTDYF